MLVFRPAGVAADQFPDVVALPAQRAGRHRVPSPGLAVGHDRTALRQLVLMPEHPSGAELLGARDVTGGVLGLVAHIQQKRRLEVLELRRGDRRRLNLGQIGEADRITLHPVDAHPHQVIAHGLSLVLILSQQDQRPGLGFGVIGPGAEAGELAAGRDIQCPEDGTLLDLVVGAGVHEDRPVLLQGATHLVRGERLKRRQRTQHGGAFFVLALHPPEVGVSVRLTIEELIDEALLVIGGEVLGPPGVGPLVADRGGRQRAQGLAAGAT